MTAVDERLAGLITLLETRLQLVDGFDDRLARVETTAVQLAQTEKNLASLAWKLASARIATSWVSGAIAGAISAAVVLWIFFHSGIAAACH